MAITIRTVVKPTSVGPFATIQEVNAAVAALNNDSLYGIYDRGKYGRCKYNQTKIGYYDADTYGNARYS